MWLLLLVVPSASAQRSYPMLLRTEASVALMEEGRAALWDLRYYEAEHLFQQMQQRPDGAVAGAYHLAYLALFQALFTDSRSTFDAFYARSDALLDALGEAPASPWRTYLEAEAHLHRAMAGAKTERYVRAALAARTAYRQYQAVLEADSTFYEAYAGTGVFNIIIGSMPSSYQRLLSILGYRGSVTEGIAQLETAAEKSRYAAKQARIILALTDIMLNNAAGGGVERLGALHEQNPDSPLFAYLYGFALLSDRQAVAAQEKLQYAYDAGRSATYFFVDYAEFYLAQALFFQNRFDDAIRHYRHYIQRHQGQALKALAHLELGLSLEMQGRRDEALDYYQHVSTGRVFDSDQAAQRLAERRLRAPMTAAERQLQRGRNAFDAGTNEAALTYLLPVFETGTTDERAEAAYRLGRVYHTLAEATMNEAAINETAIAATNSAMRYYQAAIDHPSSDPLDRWAPWAQFYIAQLHAAAGRTAAARDAYEAALAYDAAYDYHQALEQQAKLGLAKLGE